MPRLLAEDHLTRTFQFASFLPNVFQLKIIQSSQQYVWMFSVSVSKSAACHANYTATCNFQYSLKVLLMYHFQDPFPTFTPKFLGIKIHFPLLQYTIMQLRLSTKSCFWKKSPINMSIWTYCGCPVTYVVAKVSGGQRCGDRNSAWETFRSRDALPSPPL